jgi:hypothetical protein
MTPKEKAEELVNKMYDTFSESSIYENEVSIDDRTAAEQLWIKNFDSYSHTYKDFSKKCALVCCDEVLGHMGADRGVEFWQEVKKEIEAI